MEKNIWDIVKDEFDSRIPRLTGFNVKENDRTNHFVYPSGWDTIGYNFDFSLKSGYDNSVKFRIDFGMYEYRKGSDSYNLTKVVFDKCIYYPSLVKRFFTLPYAGFKGIERLGRSSNEGLTWCIDIESLSDFFTLNRCFVTVLKSDEQFAVSMKGNVITLSFKDMDYHIACSQNIKWTLYENETSMKHELTNEGLGRNVEKGCCLVIKHELELKPREHYRIMFGLSEYSASMALEASMDNNFEDSIRIQWNSWFNSLPKVKFKDEKEERCYYKSWAVIRGNYYESPMWGHSVLEALPVYKGAWQWAMSSTEWISDQDTYQTSVWFKSAMDFFIKMQREDGYITHAMYIDEEKPGERWAKGAGIIQTPHFPWVALRYYYTTMDKEALRRWYEPLNKYYEYLNNTRDKNFRNLHLWAIITSFDTGLDTTPAFQKVTYGENGVKEQYCYPAIFAAARYRYEQSMGMIADILGLDPGRWYEEAEVTKQAMDRYLWDDKKKWYGVLHEDGTLDTRVGVDGLFPLAYHMVDRDRASAMERNFTKLIGNYGIYTVAPGEEGFIEDVYWRGPAWPQSCSVGMEVCRYYYPHLLDRVLDSTINMILSNPSIWECYNARTGEVARSDHGFVCTPAISSNVGAGGILGAILIYHGFDMYGIDDVLPLTYMENFHWGGMRITVTRNENGWIVSGSKQERDRSTVKFADSHGKIHQVDVKEEQEVLIKI